MFFLLYIAIFLGGYLIGSIPFGLLIGLSQGKDVRKEGSGNIGATNVTRVVGSKAGKLCFALDFLKGAIPITAVAILTKYGLLSELEFARIIALVAPVIGHMFPIWLKFKGGKGVATAAGAVLALAPCACLIGLAIWVAFFYAFKYVSLASIIAAAAVPIAAITLSVTRIQKLSITELIILSLLCLVAILRHTSNIKRLLNGTENRFSS